MKNFLKLDEKKKNQIISSALKEFSKMGYKKASTIEIAKNSGISKGSLFNYFGTKDGMYLFIYDYAISTMEERIYSKLPLEVRPLMEIISEISYEKIQLSIEMQSITSFILTAYFDQDCISPALNKRVEKINDKFIIYLKEYADMSNIKSNLTLDDVIKTVCWISEGYTKAIVDAFNRNNDNSNNFTEELKKITNECLNLIEKLICK